MPAELTPDEDQQLGVLGDALQVVREWEDLTGRPDWLQPGSGSELAGDDRRTRPYEVSHAARAAILAAVDHLACLRDSLFRWISHEQVEAKIQIYALFSLVRCALENASWAVWMLEEDGRDERILRRLQLELAEVKAQQRVRDVIGPPGRLLADRFEDLTVLLQPTFIDEGEIQSGAGHAGMVNAAGAHLSGDGSGQEVMWRMFSAFAHGDFRATIGYSALEVLAEVSPGVGLANVTAKVPLLIAGALDAISIMKVARQPTTTSISTAAPSGRAATPIAVRAG